jgi:hypothetical protein
VLKGDPAVGEASAAGHLRITMGLDLPGGGEWRVAASSGLGFCHLEGAAVYRMTRPLPAS